MGSIPFCAPLYWGKEMVPSRNGFALYEYINERKLMIAFLGIAAIAGFFLRSEYEKRHFVTEKFVICSPKLEKEEVNFVFLSDLHNNTFGRNHEKLLSQIDHIHPDGILIGGDMMICKGKKELEPAMSLVKSLSKRYPVYYANGNHEERMKRERNIYGDLYHEFTEILKESGVIYLSDRSVEIDGNIRITGCNMKDIYYSHRFTIPKLPENELSYHVGKASEKKFQILLLHSPLFFKECRNWGADLTLSGHFHGGTIRLPFLGGVMTPQYQFFVPWCDGKFEEEGKTMIVSRGLGTHSINIRFLNKPQLLWICLRRSGG